MSDLRSSFITKDFVINFNIIKCLSSINITLDEFLLILYFINVGVDLNSEDIKDKLGFDDDKTTEIFTSLLNKKYIEMIVINKNKELIEQINLNPFYDRLALNQKVDINNEDIYSLFEKELGRTLSTFEFEMINNWIEKGINEELIKEALKESILNGVTNFKYIDKIVYDWNKNGIKKKEKEKEGTLEDMFDYDWLDDNE